MHPSTFNPTFHSSSFPSSFTKVGGDATGSSLLPSINNAYKPHKVRLSVNMVYGHLFVNMVYGQSFVNMVYGQLFVNMVYSHLFVNMVYG